MKSGLSGMTNMDEDNLNGEEPKGALPNHISSTANHESSSDCSRVPEPLNSAEPAKLIDLYKCAGCNKPIYDQYYSWVDRRTWHESCVQCTVCRQALVDSCYTKNCQLYCQQDYKQLQQCRRCSKLIACNDLMQKIAGQTFHLSCFVCDICHQQLQSGDHCVLDSSTNQIHCKTCKDFDDDARLRSHQGHDDDSASDSERSDDEVFSHQSIHMPGLGHFPNYMGSAGHPHELLRSRNGSNPSPTLSMMTSSLDGKRVKRPRTILTTAQRRKFKASFEVSQKPCRKVRETLAAETGLSARVVQVWFQNQRAKMKKLARRQQDGQRCSRGGNRSRRKKTTDSDSDNEISSPSSYTSLPTPHQNTLYHDTYRSPGSTQTSPITSASEANSYYHAGLTTRERADLLYDDYDSTNLPNDPSSDVFMTPGSHTVTSSEPSSSLRMSMEARLHINMAQPIGDFNNNGGLCSDGDQMSGASPQDGFQSFGPSQVLTPYPSQTSAEGNPIDRLMYMQNNFFRT